MNFLTRVPIELLHCDTEGLSVALRVAPATVLQSYMLEVSCVNSTLLRRSSDDCTHFLATAHKGHIDVIIKGRYTGKANSVGVAYYRSFRPALARSLACVGVYGLRVV